MNPTVTHFFDQDTFTYSYVVADPETKKCAIIDSVLDFDHASGRTSTKSADAIIAHVNDNGLSVEWIMETHAHADHLSAAPYLKEKLGGKTTIGEHITEVQKVFRDVFNFEKEFLPDGSQFDHLLSDNETFMIGNLEGKALHTPGHTPACMAYVIGNACFAGDTIFMPDFGSARCDFPGGDAETLYDSVQRLFTLPDDTRLFMCHDYKAPGRDHYAHETTIKEERENNIHLGHNATKEEFVKMRSTRDAELSMPRLILPSVQINIRAGEKPPADNNGVRYLKLPLDAL